MKRVATAIRSLNRKRQTTRRPGSTTVPGVGEAVSGSRTFRDSLDRFLDKRGLHRSEETAQLRLWNQ